MKAGRPAKRASAHQVPRSTAAKTHGAARSVARAWLQLEDPVGFVWSFVGGEPKINRFERLDQVPAVSPEAEAMSRALKKAGFSFVGPTICYAYMQACGMVMDHLIDCERHAALVGGD